MVTLGRSCSPEKNLGQRRGGRQKNFFQEVAGQALTTVVIDSRQQPESLSADQLIRHEVHAPYFVGVLDQHPKFKVRFGPDRPSLRRSRRPTARSSARKTLREHNSPGYNFW